MRGRGGLALSQCQAEAFYPLIQHVMDANIIRRDAEIRNLLLEKSTGNDIAAEVAREALSHSYESVEAFFTDLQNYGCVCGMI